MNFVPARVEDGAARGQGILRPLQTTGADRNVLLGVRPHDLRINSAEPDLSFAIEVIEPLGFEAYAHGTIGGSRAVVRLEAHELQRVRAGATLPLRIEPDKLRVFPGERENGVRL
jgi:ABC-type sugar transport system ATPase subunit